MMKLSRMSKFVLLLSPLALTLATGTYAQDQYPILDKVAAKVVAEIHEHPLRSNCGKRNKHHHSRLRHKNKRQYSF